MVPIMPNYLPKILQHYILATWFTNVCEGTHSGIKILHSEDI